MASLDLAQDEVEAGVVAKADQYIIKLFNFTTIKFLNLLVPSPR